MTQSAKMVAVPPATWLTPVRLLDIYGWIQGVTDERACSARTAVDSCADGRGLCRAATPPARWQATGHSACDKFGFVRSA